jgi:hypothetical protein
MTRVNDRRIGKKKIFKFTFNYKGEIHDVYTHGLNEDVGFGQATFKLAQKLGITGYALRCYFLGKQNSYSSVEVKQDDTRDKSKGTGNRAC